MEEEIRTRLERNPGYADLNVRAVAESAIDGLRRGVQCRRCFRVLSYFRQETTLCATCLEIQAEENAANGEGADAAKELTSSGWR